MFGHQRVSLESFRAASTVGLCVGVAIVEAWEALLTHTPTKQCSSGVTVRHRSLLSVFLPDKMSLLNKSVQWGAKLSPPCPETHALSWAELGRAGGKGSYPISVWKYFLQSQPKRHNTGQTVTGHLPERKINRIDRTDHGGAVGDDIGVIWNTKISILLVYADYTFSKRIAGSMNVSSKCS